MQRSGPSSASLNVCFARDDRFMSNESLGEIEESGGSEGSDENGWNVFDCMGNAAVWPRLWIEGGKTSTSILFFLVSKTDL